MPGIIWYLVVAVFFLAVVILAVPSDEKPKSGPPLAIGPALLIPNAGKTEGPKSP